MATPGLAEDGFEFYSFAGAARARDALAAFNGGAVVVGVLGAVDAIDLLALRFRQSGRQQRAIVLLRQCLPMSRSTTRRSQTRT